MAHNTAWTLDTCVNVLLKTIFSPFFCIFIPLTIAGRVKDWAHPGVYWSAVWAASLSIISLLRYLNRLYAAAGSWLFLPKKLNWEEQIVLITGGGSGIGALLAETLALRNVTVVILTLAPPKNPIDNDNVYTYLCDVSKYDEVEACSKRVVEEIGHPTILVNNAGIVKGKLLLDLSEKDVREFITADIAFLPEMIKKSRGHIVTVASLLGVVAAAQSTDYCASKAALVNLHQSLRFELDNRYKAPQIRTTLLLPSFITTELFASVRLPSAAWSLFAFLFPEIHPHQIVKAIIQALDSDEGRVIRMPFYTNLARVWTVAVGVVPKPVVDLFQWIMGADWAMREYGPKPNAAERLIAERNARRKDAKYKG